MPPFSICIPYKSDGQLRDFIFDWTLARWRALFPDADIAIGEDDSGDVQLNRSRMRNNAVRQAKGDLFFILDADVFIADAKEFDDLINLLPGAGMVSYNRYYPLTPDQNVDILVQEPSDQLILPLLTERDSAGFGGCFFGLTRDAFDKMGGFDERFIGWGCEDPAALIAIETLVGPVKRSLHNIYHLWHVDSPDKNTSSPSYQQNLALWHQYEKYNGKPDALRQYFARAGR